MAEIRCPMCGKPNPPEREVCQFCQARLVPLVAPPNSQDAAPASSEEPQTLGGSPESDAAIPEWLRSLQKDDEEGSQENAIEEGEGQDWLGDFRQDSAEEESLSDSEEDEAETEWWSPSEAPAEEGIPDWLAGMRPEDTPGTEEPQDALPDEGEEPEWLLRIRDRQRAEQPEDSGEPSGEEPDWLSELGASSPPEESLDAGEIPEAEQPAEGDEPDWFSEEQSESVSSPEETEESIPDWLSNFVAGQADSESESESEEQSAPAWLSALDEAEIPEEGSDSSTSEDEISFDWLDEQKPEAPADEESSQPESEEEAVAPFAPEQEGELYPGELPDWLANVPSQEKPFETAETPEAESEAESGLEPAKLPSWLEAMRPVESAAPAPIQDETYKTVESSGPLAGLRGVLPAEPEIARLKKPSAYTVKLQVTDNQQAHAEMLEGILKAEGQAKALPTRPAISTQYILRVVIFIILVAAILWPVLLGSQQMALPAFTSETFDASSAINALSGGAPVLVAVDYEPGLSAEMDAASAAVIDHLMIKGAYLTIVSTIPTGPAQAERLIHNVDIQGNHEYQDVNQYADLGYIPGGTTGLLSFAESPQQVTPFAQDGSRAWETGPLKNVQSLGQFAMLLVITDSPENGQAWIEQVQPKLDGSPLVMVVSAQVEPLVRPYYEASPRQVQGIVSGLAGGAAYENIMSRNGPARKYWDAFSMGLLVAGILILLGGVVNAATYLLSRRSRVEGEEKA